MSREICIGKLKIGDKNPVAIQTMSDIKTSKISDVLRQIRGVYEIGCDIFRVAVKDDEDALAIRQIAKLSPVPIVCDIHFDYRLALKSIENGAHKIRINPGNIGSDENIRQVSDALKANDVAVRVGANSGSIEKKFLDKYGRGYKALSESALDKVAVLERQGVEKIVISVKASDVQTTVLANKYLSQKTSYPLHLGVTEAGTTQVGVVKSAIGIGALLLEGIGDTIRVSLTAPIEEEILTAKRILRSVGLEKNYVEVISCPTCGRTSYNCADLAMRVEAATAGYKKPLKIAVMGCVVNGPGEASNCDLGIAGGDGKCVIFKFGKVYRTIDMQIAETEFLKEIELLLDSGNL